mgnify:CR=1 FL=1
MANGDGLTRAFDMLQPVNPALRALVVQRGATPDPHYASLRGMRASRSVTPMSTPHWNSSVETWPR